MVANNPLFSGRWTLKKFNATVVNDIWPEVLFFTGVATGESPVQNFLAFRAGVVSPLLTQRNPSVFSGGRCDDARHQGLGNR